VVELLIPLHGIGGRGDLPVPLWLAIYSAGAAVAVSFFALAAFWSRPRFEVTAGRSLDLLTRIVDNRLTRRLIKLAGLAALALMLGCLVRQQLTGSQPGTDLAVRMDLGRHHPALPALRPHLAPRKPLPHNRRSPAQYVVPAAA
jgi:hypothetical protein